MLYVLAGVAVTPIHADEFMQMAMARDVFYLARGQMDRVRFAPPIMPDTEQDLRLLNGPLNKNLIGVAWILAGRSDTALPGIFAWAMPLAWNASQGNVPDADALRLARWPSALLTALGVVAIFGLCWQIGKAWLAYPAALLYALDPAILLNGRRAVMEGGLLLCTLLLIGVAVWIAQRVSARSPNDFPPLSLTLAPYALLGVIAGLTVAAKHTGVIAVVAVFAALLWIAWPQMGWRALAWLIIAGLLALLTFFVLNPAYWSDPLAVARAVLVDRSALLARQIQSDPAAYSSPLQRIAGTLTEPLIGAPQYYEAPTWNGVIDDAIRAYEASPWGGWPPWVGVVVTFAALIGLGGVVFRAVRKADPAARVLVIWFGAELAGALAVPIRWQRYYLPMLLPMLVLAAYAVWLVLMAGIARTAPVLESPSAVRAL